MLFLCNLDKITYILKVSIIQTIRWGKGGIIYVFLRVILLNMIKYFLGLGECLVHRILCNSQ